MFGGKDAVGRAEERVGPGREDREILVVAVDPKDDVGAVARELVDTLITDNNRLTAFLTVLEGGLRVLYVYGDLLGEQRLLRRSIDASDTE